MKRICPWLAPLLVLALGTAYLLIPSFELGVNQVCEMLTTGNSRGLMMVLHAAGAHSAVTAVGIGCLAFLLIPLKPQYLLIANTEYYGQIPGLFLTALGAACAALVLMMAWHTVWTVLPDTVRQTLERITRHEFTLPALFSILLLSRIF